MSVFEDDLVSEATMDMFTETINLQGATIESLNDKLKSYEEIHRKTSRDLKQTLSINKALQEKLKQLERAEKQNKADIERLELSEYDWKLKACSNGSLLREAEEEIAILKEEKDVEKALAAHDLKLKDEAIAHQFSEIGELKMQRDAERHVSEDLVTENLHWMDLYKAKCIELGEFKDSFKRLSASEERLLVNTQQLKVKIDQTIASAIESEESNKALQEENQKLKDSLKHFETEAIGLKASQQQLKIKLEEMTTANLELGSKLTQREESLERLKSQSADTEKVINQLAEDNANKDESFCAFYAKSLEEFKAKEKTIAGLKATAADNAKEILLLRSDLNEVTLNRV